VAIHTVVGGVQLALEKPGVVAVLKATAVDGLEVLGPCEEFSGLGAPERLRLSNRLLIELLVLLQA
jgi:hypothetical protein